MQNIKDAILYCTNKLFIFTYIFEEILQYCTFVQLCAQLFVSTLKWTQTYVFQNFHLLYSIFNQIKRTLIWLRKELPRTAIHIY